jgi:adenine phosphoribosyltransferase
MHRAAARALDAAAPRREHPGVTDTARLAALIRSIPDFPAPGVLFRDITPLLYDPAALREANDILAEATRTMSPTLVAGVEARGFIFGVPVAERLGLPFVPVRKPGKLPDAFASISYELEYGNAALELHRTPPVAGHRVLVIDDLLATGGTAAAVVHLVEELGGTIAGFGFLLELTDLGGRARLRGHPIATVLRY